MKLTDLTPKQLEEVKRISTIDRFAAKVAKTVLENGWFTAKQLDIINQFADEEIEYVYTEVEEKAYFTPNLKKDAAQYEKEWQKKHNNLPSSMR